MVPIAHAVTKEQKAFRKLIEIWEGPDLQIKLEQWMLIITDNQLSLEQHCNLVFRNILSIVTAIYEKGYSSISPAANMYRRLVKSFLSVSPRSDFMNETDQLFHKKLPDEFVYSTIRNGSNYGINDEGLTLLRAKKCIKFLNSKLFDDVLIEMDNLQSGRLWIAHQN